MSFGVTKVGPPLKVAEELNEIKFDDELGRTVRDLLVRELSVPLSIPNVIVKMNGHSTKDSYFNLTVSVEPVWGT